MIKIAIADDHQLILNSLRQLFSEEKDISITDVAITYEQVTRIYNSKDWDILILDIIMPKKNGFEVFNELKKHTPSAKVLFLSNLFDEEIVFKAEILGADGFVHKANASDELITAIRCINNGGKYFHKFS